MRTRSIAGTLTAALLSSGLAHALQCHPPARYVGWTYPNASTTVVPTNAVFWGIGYSNRLITLEIDGVEVPSLGEARGLSLIDDTYFSDDARVPRFQRRYDFPLETSQFVPPEPLAPGEHEIAIRALDYGLEPDTYLESEIYRFSVRAEELPPVDTDVEITSVTGYAWDYQYGSPAPDTFPPPEATDGVCGSERMVHSGAYCDYGAPGPPRADLLANVPATRITIEPGVSLTGRIDITAGGSVLGYLLDYLFVPADCSAFFASATPVAPDDAGELTARSFYVEPVLPTGLGAAHGFTGDIEIVEGIGTPPVHDFQGKPGWCSISSVGARRNDAGITELALFVGSAALLRRSRRTRQFPPRV
jgi:hypothetical protein